MPELLLATFSCDSIPYPYAIEQYSFLPTGISSAGVSGNCWSFYQFGGLSGGLILQMGSEASSQVVSGCHVNFAGTPGTACMWHGHDVIAFGLGVIPRVFGSGGFNTAGLPFVQAGSGIAVDESGFFVHPGVWYYVEMQSDISTEDDDDNPGYVKVFCKSKIWVDGRLAAEHLFPQFTGIRFLSADAADAVVKNVLFSGVGVQTSMDNVYLKAGSVRLGGVRIQRYYPRADGFHTAWTPDSGSDHYSRINEDPVSEASYVAATANGDKDSYLFDSINPDIVEAIGGTLYPYSAGITSPAESRTLRTFARVSGTDNVLYTRIYDSGPGLVLPFPFEYNPVTGLPWTKAELDATEFGFYMNA